MTDALNTSVSLTPEAAEYVRARGGFVVLHSTYRHGCCGGRVELVKADASSDAPGDGFDGIRLSNGITILAETGLLADLGRSITIGLDSLLGFEALYVEGADSKM